MTIILIFLYAMLVILVFTIMSFMLVPEKYDKPFHEKILYLIAFIVLLLLAVWLKGLFIA